MYNNEVAQKLIQKYGNEKFAIYVELEVAKNQMIEDELKSMGDDPDMGYNAYFWKTKYEEMLNQENH